MTPAEALELLAKARMIDVKVGEPDDARASMWAELLEDVPLAAAEVALKQHYRASTETIMPAHIREALKKLRSEVREGRRRAEWEREWERQRKALIGAQTANEAPRWGRGYEEYKAERARLRLPSSRKAFENSKQVKCRGPEKGADKPRGRDPQRLGGLLRVVSEQVKPRNEEAA